MSSNWNFTTKGQKKEHNREQKQTVIRCVRIVQRLNIHQQRLVVERARKHQNQLHEYQNYTAFPYKTENEKM